MDHATEIRAVIDRIVPNYVATVVDGVELRARLKDALEAVERQAHERDALKSRFDALTANLLLLTALAETPEKALIAEFVAGAVSTLLRPATGEELQAFLETRVAVLKTGLA